MSGINVQIAALAAQCENICTKRSWDNTAITIEANVCKVTPHIDNKLWQATDVEFQRIKNRHNFIYRHNLRVETETMYFFLNADS